MLDAPPTISLPRTPAPTVAHSQAPTAPAGAGSADSAPAPIPSAPMQLYTPTHQEQMLVQPDAPQDVLLLHKIPVPTAFIWAADSAPVKPVIQSTAQKLMAAKIHPAPDVPNREPRVADVRMASSNAAVLKQTVVASTTAPIVVRTPEVAQAVPMTVSKHVPESSPARILSLADVKVDGPVAIPLANATLRPSAGNSMSAGHAVTPSDSDQGNAISVRSGAKTEQAKGSSANASTLSGKTEARSAPVGQMAALSTNSAPVPSNGGSIKNLGPVTHVTLPKDGQFGVVVVGSSLAEQYPETVDIWNGRMVYSVYLHVGGGKNWILQYSAPLQTSAGSARPEPPWPYDFVRPRFDPEDYNSDALLVHGFVNAEGRFEHLALVFPSEFAKVKFLLSALQQWQFRPAHQNGQASAVEVLLIIPEETE